MKLGSAFCGLCILLAIAASCGPRMLWMKPGATEADFRRDSYECERDARQSGYFGTGFVGQMNMEQFAGRCMRAKGYELVPASSAGGGVPRVTECPYDNWAGTGCRQGQPVR